MAGQHGAVTAWRRWGPYASERSWGTVREDYSADGNAWDYFPHDHARSPRLPLGRGRDGRDLRPLPDPLLRAGPLERARPDPEGAPLRRGPVGRQPRRGRQGVLLLPRLHAHPLLHEVALQVPAARVPVPAARRGEPRRGGRGPEFELLDTGIFDDDRYFDVFVEYAKASPEDMAIRVTVHNRGPEAAPIQVLPHLWFRNTWAWGPAGLAAAVDRDRGGGARRATCSLADDSERRAPAQPAVPLPPGHRAGWSCPPAASRCSPTTRRTRRAALGAGRGRAARRYVKDAFHRYVVNGETGAVDPARQGHQGLRALPRRGAGGRLGRLPLPPHRRDRGPTAGPAGRGGRDRRRAAARRRTPSTTDIQPARATADEKLVQRQAFAGMLWSKQIYLLRREPVVRGRQPGLPRRRARASGSATRTGAISTRCASCPCRTSGSTRGSRPGTSPSTARRSPSWTRSSPRSSSGCCSSSSSSTPPASSPPTSGSSRT